MSSDPLTRDGFLIPEAESREVVRRASARGLESANDLQARRENGGTFQPGFIGFNDWSMLHWIAYKRAVAQLMHLAAHEGPQESVEMVADMMVGFKVALDRAGEAADEAQLLE